MQGQRGQRGQRGQGGAPSGRRVPSAGTGSLELGPRAVGSHRSTGREEDDTRWSCGGTREGKGVPRQSRRLSKSWGGLGPGKCGAAPAGRVLPSHTFLETPRSLTFLQKRLPGTSRPRVRQLRGPRSRAGEGLLSPGRATCPGLVRPGPGPLGSTTPTCSAPRPAQPRLVGPHLLPSSRRASAPAAARCLARTAAALQAPGLFPSPRPGSVLTPPPPLSCRAPGKPRPVPPAGTTWASRGFRGSGRLSGPELRPTPLPSRLRDP